MRSSFTVCLGALTVLCAAISATGADWPQWGGGDDRNMVSAENGLPDLRATPGETATRLSGEDCPYVKWKVRVGSTSWGNPTMADGRVFVGASGPHREGGTVKCFSAASGDLLWQLICPARDFPTPLRPEKFDRYGPWDYLVTTHAQTLGWGVCSSTTVDEDRAYVLTQRGELVCLDVHGLANGNQGPFTDEARYKAGDGEPPAALEPTDADILWMFDLWTEVVTRPADTFSNAGIIHGDLLYLSTCNGIERFPLYHGYPAKPPNPDAPNLIVLDKHTGRLVATDEETIGHRMLHGQWCCPSLGKVNGKTLLFYGGGDGVCYAFEALSEVPREPVKLKKVWSYDCNPPEYKGIGVENYSLGDIDVLRQAPGDRRAVAADRAKHIDHEGRLLSMSEIIGSPVFHEGRVYVAIGRDPRHGPGRGALHCIDASGTGDISKSGRVWCYTDIDRSLGTPSVIDDRVYAADLTGRLHCLEKDSGRPHWIHDAKQETWGSTLVADGKVYLVTRKSLLVFADAKEEQLLATVRMGAECSPIAAGGVVYVVLRGTLYALHRGQAATVVATSPTEKVATTPTTRPAPTRTDWPGWRGPRGNGTSPDVPRRLPPQKLVWSRAMRGECYAPISVAEGIVVAADHADKRDSWCGMRASDGSSLWTYEYANAEKMEYGAAPRTAPRIYQGKVYCLSAWGELICLELASGKVCWKKHLAREFQQKTPTWGYTCSPLVADDKLIINPGGSGGPVAALDPDSGAILWTGEGSGLNYSSFTLATFGGAEQLVGYDQKSAGGWDPKTGRRLWTYKVDNSYGYIVPAPLVVGRRVLLTSDQENARLIGFRASGAIDTKPTAENEDLAPDICTPTLCGDLILGCSAGLVLLDPAAPGPGGGLKTLWHYDEEDCVTGMCHVIGADDRALVMCEDGQLLLLAIDCQACKILGRTKLCGRTWVAPALADGKLYVRDATRLYCYEMPADQSD